MSTLLDVRDLTVTYGQGKLAVPAVRGVSFTLERGEILGVAGESGSGKSSMALSLLRLLPQSAHLSGQVLYEGEDLQTMDWGRLRAVRWAEASLVFQGAMSALNPVQSVGDQICEPIILHDRVGTRVATQRCRELLDSVGVSARRMRSYPHELSGGQRQRVMIAMALACRPDLILADEPTTALDVMVQAQILQLLTELVSASGIGVIMISHDLSVLADTCHRVAVMYAGQLVETGPGDQLFTAPRHPYTQALSRAFPTIGDPTSRLLPTGLPGDPPTHSEIGPGCAFAPRCSQVLPDCWTHQITLWPSGPRRRSACVRVLPDYPDLQTAPSRAAATGATPEPPVRLDPVPDPVSRGAALEVCDLYVTYPGRGGRGPARAVDGVNLTIHEREIVALIGESGCGKSTLARALIGLVKPTRGVVRYRGEPLSYSSGALKAYRRNTQLVLQDPGGALNPRQNVFDLVAEGPRLHGLTGNLNQRVHRAMAQAGLRPPDEFTERFPHELSGGQQQRVVIAGALALEPSVIVADEPVSSLDASVRGEILRLLLSLRDDLGLSALVVSHDLGLAWNIADRVAVMYLGRIVEIGTVEEVLLRPQHPYTRALLSVLPDATTERTTTLLAGEPPDPTAIASGCRFHPRCPAFAGLEPSDPRRELCQSRELVPITETGPPGSRVSCHLVTEQAPHEETAYEPVRGS